MSITQEHINAAVEIISELDGTEDECLTDESVVEYMVYQGFNLPDAHAVLCEASSIYEYTKVT